VNVVGSLTEVQHSIVIGSLLGDGAMRCKANALLEINHCFEQRAYVDWKYRHLIDLVGTAPKARTGNGSRVAYRSTTLSRSELTPYHASFYGGGVKSIPALELTPLALAVWFMDDGSKSYRTVYLNTQQFDVPSQERIEAQLQSQFGIRVSLKRDKIYYRLRMAVESVSRFRRIIDPHLLKEFTYKLPA
jgi:recombination protein RecA